VVTGIGAVSPLGWDVAAFRRGLLAGTCAIGPSRSFDTSGQRTDIAGEVGPAPEWIDLLATRSGAMTRADLFAVVAAKEACQNASITPSECSSGVFFGGSTAGMAECEEYVARMLGFREGRPRLGLLRSQQLNGPGDAVARALTMTGPVETISSACASGALAIGAALDALRNGEVDVAVAGGSDGLCLLTYSGFNALRLVDPNPCLPFRPGRQGMNLGEGSGVLVLETLGHARGRGARPVAELLGAGASCDAHHMTAPQPDGEGSVRAMRAAIRDAGITEDDITFVNAHGTGTIQNDISEARAIRTVFGQRASDLPVTAVKGAIGHLLGTAGAIEAVQTVLCFLDRCVYRTTGEDGVDGACDVNLVLEDHYSLPDHSLAISMSFAFGGTNAALILADWRENDGL
jgi:3-oxoacyl-[acyl-carrier-protein] synthase II